MKTFVVVVCTNFPFFPKSKEEKTEKKLLKSLTRSIKHIFHILNVGKMFEENTHLHASKIYNNLCVYNNLYVVLKRKFIVSICVLSIRNLCKCMHNNGIAKRKKNDIYSEHDPFVLLYNYLKKIETKSDIVANMVVERTYVVSSI